MTQTLKEIKAMSSIAEIYFDVRLVETFKNLHDEQNHFFRNNIISIV